MFKIQMRVTNEDQAILAKVHFMLEWQDLVDMPSLTSEAQAEQWLQDNRAHELAPYGLEFRVIPVEPS